MSSNQWDLVLLGNRMVRRLCNARSPNRRSNMIGGHIAKEMTKLLNCVKRLRGQTEAIDRSINSDLECAKMLQ